MKPHEFWRLDPIEFWLMVSAKTQGKMYGSMPEHVVADLYEELAEGGYL